jgi:hypothetical protein
MDGFSFVGKIELIKYRELFVLFFVGSKRGTSRTTFILLRLNVFGEFAESLGKWSG